MISLATSSESQSCRNVAPSPSPSSAATPALENDSPKMLAARRSRRAGAGRPSSRAWTMASTVLGSSSPLPSAMARTISSRKNALPSARSTTRSTIASSVAAPRHSRTRRAAAFLGRRPRRISVRLRSAHRFGNDVCTSGRASATTMNGWPPRCRAAASTNVTLGTSPQCRSSSTRRIGCRDDSAWTQSSHARRI